MLSTEFANGIYYVGVNDRTTSKFEAIWPLPYGVSYNSYIVRGNFGTALIDGVEQSQSFKQIRKIQSIADIKPDYLVVNHMEPDHTGTILALMEAFPEMRIIGNAKTAGMLKGYYGIDSRTILVGDGDEINLGGKTLKFFLTPMVHWPETMMTYVIEDKVLFSGDAFGSFGALNGGIVDEEMNTDHYFPEMVRYYSNIVGKYGIPVQKALAKLDGLPIEYICSTHGPVWHKQIGKTVSLYNRLSKGESKNGVVIVYGSMYGHTEDMVEIVARQLAACGIKDIKIHNVSYSDESQILRDIYDFKGFIVATPTYNGNLFPKIDSLLKSLVLRGVSNKIFARLGSFTWAGVGTKTIDASVSNLNFRIIGEPIEMKQSCSDEVASRCRALAVEFADALNA